MMTMHPPPRARGGSTARMHRARPKRLVSKTSCQSAIVVSSIDPRHMTAALLKHLDVAPISDGALDRLVVGDVEAGDTDVNALRPGRPRAVPRRHDRGGASWPRHRSRL